MNKEIGTRVAINSLTADEQATLKEGKFIFKDTMTIEQFMEEEKCPRGIDVKRGNTGKLFWTYGAKTGAMKNEVPTRPMISHVIGHAKDRQGNIIPEMAEHMYLLHNEGQGGATQVAHFG